MKKQILYAAIALVAASIACASPFQTLPTTYIVVGPDPTLSMPPDDMQAAGEVIKARLDAQGLGAENVKVGEDSITVYYADPADLDTVTRLATEQGILVFFGADAELTEGSAIPEGVEVVLSNADIVSATPEVDSYTRQPVVSLNFTDQGSQKMADYSAAHIGGILAIARDGVVIMAPTINSAITGGSADITGTFTEDEVILLANQLSSGPLPFPLQLVETGPAAP